MITPTIPSYILRDLLDAARELDDDLDRREEAPDGDTYNELWSIIDQARALLYANDVALSRRPRGFLHSFRLTLALLMQDMAFFIMPVGRSRNEMMEITWAWHDRVQRETARLRAPVTAD